MHTALVVKWNGVSVLPDALETAISFTVDVSTPNEDLMHIRLLHEYSVI